MDDGRTYGRTDDGRTTEHGYTISSPCEPDGSGELKTHTLAEASQAPDTNVLMSGDNDKLITSPVCPVYAVVC